MSTKNEEDRDRDETGYSCTWQNYQVHLAEVVRQLLEEGCMVDVTLCAGGVKIQAHRLVLCAFSTLFQEILNPVNEEHVTIILDDMNPEDVRQMIDFMYNGEIKVDGQNLKRLLGAAETLQICGLTEVVKHLEANELTCAFSDKDTSAEETNANDFSEVDEDFIMTTEENEDGDSFTADDVNSFDEKRRISNDSNSDSQKKKIKRKSASKKEYTDEMLAGAIEAIKTGSTLLDAATSYRVPRSTLYMHTKLLGIPLNAPRSDYTDEDMKAAMELVMKGSSLQQAAVCYGIPKTVLWRRLQKEGYSIRHDSRKTYGIEKREAAIKALERGEALSKVASEYKIPKTTLFRDKVRLVDEGKLPESFWKKRKSYMEGPKRDLLEEAVAACKEGKMSQAAASTAYKIPKTTIWRRLHNQVKMRDTDTCEKTQLTEESSEEMDTANMKVEEFTAEDFGAYCGDDSEMNITYIDENDLSNEQVIILASGNSDTLDLTGNRSLVVVQGDGDEHFISSLELDENSELITKS